MSNHLPLELISDVLHRLPVKSLLRFKSVSKSWRSLIEDSSFVNSHSKQSDKFMVLQCYNDKRFYRLELGSLDKAIQIASLERSLCTELMGSCNGLVALICLCKNTEVIILWNVATREYQEIKYPRCLVPFVFDYPRCNRGYGFGYESVGDDYKVVIIECVGESVSVVYSLRRNEWTWRVDAPRFSADSYPKGVLISGALHWVSKAGLIVSLDLDVEEYGEVPLPNSIKPIINVGDLDGCLFMTNCHVPFTTRFDAWVMKDYMVKESWSKLYSVDNFFVSPFVYPKNSTEIIVLVQFDKSLYRYNSPNREGKKLEISNIPGSRIQDVLVSVESLVAISAYTGVAGTRGAPTVTMRRRKGKKQGN